MGSPEGGRRVSARRDRVFLPGYARRVPDKRTRWTGVYVRHRAGCPALDDRRCRCAPSYLARVWDAERKRPLSSPVFAQPAEALLWKQDTAAALRNGGLVRREGIRVAEASQRFVRAIADGSALNKKGRRYKATAIRDVEGALRLYVIPELGTRQLADVRRADVQKIVDQLVVAGLSGSRVRTAVNAIRSLFSWAIARGLADASPIAHIRLPAMRETPRDRVADPDELGRLLEVLPLADQIPLALAGYATARRVEILGLRWRDVSLQRGVVELAEDDVDAKTDAARRAVPMVPLLASVLRQEWLRQGRPDGTALVCPGHKPGGRNSGRLSVEALYTRCDERWKAAGLTPIRLHEARHTAASYLRAAGLDLKVRATLMGHASTATTARGSITDDRYTHLLPGDLEGAGQALASFLGRADKSTAGRT